MNFVGIHSSSKELKGIRKRLKKEVLGEKYQNKIRQIGISRKNQISEGISRLKGEIDLDF